MEAQRRGRIILLNGASTSGKTSIGRALLPLLADRAERSRATKPRNPWHAWYVGLP